MQVHTTSYFPICHCSSPAHPSVVTTALRLLCLVCFMSQSATPAIVSLLYSWAWCQPPGTGPFLTHRIHAARWQGLGHSPYHHYTCQQRWPALCVGLSWLIRRLLMDPEVSPVIQRLQRIPLTLKDEGTAELQMMLAVGEIDQSMLPPGPPTWSLSEKSLAEYESVWTCIWNLFPTSTLSPRMRSWPLTSMGRRSLLSYTCSKVTCRCHSIRPAETSQRWSHTGVYRYTSMPFGLSAAPSCFQKMMTTILAGFIRQISRPIMTVSIGWLALLWSIILRRMQRNTNSLPQPLILWGFVSYPLHM